MGKERSTATNQQLPSSPSLNLIPLVHHPPPLSLVLPKISLFAASHRQTSNQNHTVIRPLKYRTRQWIISFSPFYLPLLFKFVPFSLPLISILPSKLKSFTCAIVQILDCSSWLKFYRDRCYIYCSFVVRNNVRINSFFLLYSGFECK